MFFNKLSKKNIVNHRPVNPSGIPSTTDTHIYYIR